MRPQHSPFFFAFFEGEPLPAVCQELRHIAPRQPEQPVPMPISTGEKPLNPLYRWWVVPEYLEARLHPEYRVRKSFDMKGYAIDMSGVASATDYIQSQLKPRLRSSIRNKIKKLEAAEPIRYQLYFGEMSEVAYEGVMFALKAMIRARFLQRGDRHERLEKWELMHARSLGLIREKRASLYVIYAADKPIAISFNRHWGPVYSFSVPSYHLDYANYGMGHILIYKQLEWALEHGYLLFDMGMGPMRYKDEWCNYTYNFHTWLIYHKRTLRARTYALAVSGWLDLKQLLKSWQIHRLVRPLRKRLS